MDIALDRLRLSRAGRTVLQDLSWHIGEGERWLVVGASGAGKTQLLKVVAGDVWPDATAHAARRYFFEGEWHQQPADVRDAIAWLGPERQDRYERYGWNFTALDVVGTGLTRSDIPQGALSPRQRAACVALLRRAGMARLAARPFLTLSYGERRLVLLARTLAWQAQLLLLDEVATGLDVTNRARLYRLLEGRALRDASWVCSAHREEDIPPGVTHLLWLDAGQARYAGVMKPGRLRAALAAAQMELPRIRRPGKARTAPSGRPLRTRRALVTLDHACVYIDGKRVLHDIDLTIRRGECWVLHGANGSGKSTLLRTIYGDHGVASGGHIRRAGVDQGVPLDDFRARTALVAPHLQTEYPRHYTVLDTVVSGLHSSIGLNFAATAAEARRARSALRTLGMQAFAERPLAEMSYGQVRRILFARAFVLRPRLLLMDEALTGLNGPLRAELLGWLEQQVQAGVAVVMTTHYRAEWPRNASHELLLSRGRVQKAGTLAP
ncbi:MAG: ATP-binding cassette domain-containing protein [Steroidobacteraceae bacterium]